MVEREKLELKAAILVYLYPQILQSDQKIFSYCQDVLCIYCSGLKKDFKSSVERYIEYLEKNREDNEGKLKNKTPEVRFRQGYWFCFKPKGMGDKEWNMACKFQ